MPFLLLMCMFVQYMYMYMQKNLDAHDEECKSHLIQYFQQDWDEGHVH